MRKAWLAAMLSVVLYAGAQPDSLRLLDAVEVRYRAPMQGLMVGPDGSVTVMTSALSQGIHVLGEADALRALTMLPGFSAGSDYGGGLMVDGSDFTQNLYSIDGARVLFPYHFGGIFSDFNSAYLSSVKTGAVPVAGHPACLGSAIEGVSGSAVPDAVSGSADVGLINSGASLCLPVGSKVGVRAATRVSYIDALYGGVLSADDNTLSYGFNDANLSVTAKMSDADVLKVSGFTSSDRLRFADSGYLLSTRLRWRNAAASARYDHRSSSALFTQDLSFTGLWSHLDLDMAQFGMKMPSSSLIASTRGAYRRLDDMAQLAYRVEFARMCPQSASTEGVISAQSSAPVYRAWTFIADGRRSVALGSLLLTGALRCSFFRSSAACASSYSTFHIDPEISVAKVADMYLWRLTAKTSTQYMHQVGLSDIGMASNFWLPAIECLPAQRAYGAELFGLWRWASAFDVSAKVFAYRLSHSPDYDGDVLSLIAPDYDAMECVRSASGYNAGISLAAGYMSRSVSCRLGYGFALCRRRFADIPDQWVSAPTEPLSSFKAMAEWRILPRLNLSAFGVLASGRPYTPVRAIYAVGGNILTEYGKRYSARLPAYQRFDISATYTLPSVKVGQHKVEWLVNISVTNLFAHRNVELQYFSYNAQAQTISQRQVCSLYSSLPSASLSVRF